jgi:NTE family protein
MLHPTHGNGAIHDNKVNLILTGGGVRLPAYVGALAAIEDMGLKIGSVAGASAGSIIGSLLAAGWSASKMYQLSMETDFGRFKDFSLYTLLFRNSLYSGNQLEQWMDGQLEGAKFCELDRALYVTAVDLLAQRPVFFSRFTTPNMSVSKAVRFSMSVPGVWSAHRWDGKMLVDGDLIPWIPQAIWLMQPHAHNGAARRTIILRTTSSCAPLPPCERTTFWPWDFVRVLVGTLLTALDNERVPGWLWRDTILIDTGDIPILKFHLSQHEKKQLYLCGYEQTKRYFHKTGKRVNAATITEKACGTFELHDTFAIQATTESP